MPVVRRIDVATATCSSVVHHRFGSGVMVVGDSGAMARRTASAAAAWVAGATVRAALTAPVTHPNVSARAKGAAVERFVVANTS